MNTSKTPYSSLQDPTSAPTMDEWKSKPAGDYTEIFKYLKTIYREIRVKIKFPITSSAIQEVYREYLTPEYLDKMYEECPELRSLGKKNVEQLLAHHVLNPLSTKNFLTLQEKVENIITRFLAQLDFLAEIDEDTIKQYINRYVAKDDQVLLRYVKSLDRDVETIEDVTYPILNEKLQTILSLVRYAQQVIYNKYGSSDYYTKHIDIIKEKTIEFILSELEISHSRLLRRVEKALKRSFEVCQRHYKNIHEDQFIALYLRDPRVITYTKAYKRIFKELVELMKQTVAEELGEAPNEVFLFKYRRELKQMLVKSIIVDKLYKTVLQDPIIMKNTLNEDIKGMLDDLFIHNRIGDIFDQYALGGKEKLLCVYKIILLTDYVEYHENRYGIYSEVLKRIFDKYIVRTAEKETSLMDIARMISTREGYFKNRIQLEALLAREVEFWNTEASDSQNLFALISVFVAFNAVPAENMSTRYTNHLRCMLKCVFRNFQGGMHRFTNFQILCAIESLCINYKSQMRSRKLRRMMTTDLQRENLERIRTTSISSFEQQAGFKEQLTSLEAQIHANISKPDKFILEKISDLSVKSKCIIICISGFTSEDATKSDEWKMVPEAYPNSEVIALHWRSNTMNALFESVVAEAEHVTKAKEGLIFGFALPSLKTITLGVMAYKAIKALADEQWGSTYKEAITTGIYLAHILAETDLFKDYVINLMSFSLGTLVVMNCIWELERMNRHDVIYDVILMGGVANVGDFNQGTMSVIGHKLINCYCHNDFILRYILRMANFGSNPAGLGPILSPNKKVENLDVTSYVDGHTKYREKMYDIIAKIDFNEDFRYLITEQ